MTSTSDSRMKLWLRKPIVRVLAAFAVIIGPAAAIPLLVIGSASADTDPSGNCINGKPVIVQSLDGPTGVASVILGTDDDAAHPACNTVSLVAYTFRDPVANQAKYPQYEVTSVTSEVTSTTVPLTLTVGVDNCFSQLDVIYGDQPQAELDYAYYAAHGILLAHQDFPPNPGCTPITTPPPSTSTPPATCTSTTTVTVTPTTTASTSPSTSTSPTPPDCTTTVTSTPPPTSTPPTTCTSTTTVTVTPTTTASTSPSTSTSPTPPDCTTTVTSTPPPTSTPPTTCTSTTTVTVTPTTTASTSPSTSTSPTPPDCTTTVTSTPPTTTSSTPPVTSSSVLATSTSKPPTSSTSPVFSTSVLPFSTSKPPASTPPGTLPFTGNNAPVKSGVLLALSLISVGGGLVLFAGRRRRTGGHRVS